MRLLEHKVALIAGSSRGIGAAIATTFTESGAKVAVHGRDAAAADAVRDGIARTGAMRLAIEEGLGPVEILVINAGGNVFVPPGPIEDIDLSVWQATIDANLTAAFLTVKSILPGMKSRRSGAIITISSAAARRSTERSPTACTAAKAGIQVLTQILAGRPARSVSEPIASRRRRASPSATSSVFRKLSSRRWPALILSSVSGRLAMLGRAALFLASEHSTWVTGTVLDVAGGAVMR